MLLVVALTKDQTWDKRYEGPDLVEACRSLRECLRHVDGSYGTITLYQKRPDGYALMQASVLSEDSKRWLAMIVPFPFQVVATEEFELELKNGPRWAAKNLPHPSL